MVDDLPLQVTSALGGNLKMKYFRLDEATVEIVRRVTFNAHSAPPHQIQEAPNVWANHTSPL